jgi:hypothetical protein
VRTRLSSSAQVGAFVQAVEDYARSRFRHGTPVHVTGSLVLLDKSADDLAWGQVSSLWQVLVMLFAIMSLIFLSPRVGLLSMVPNVLPIIVLFGLMGWAGITLNISTSMIAVIAIGIAVDDTIHYFSEFNVQLRATGDQERAILNVVRTVGKPVVYSALALIAGFAIVCLSNFQPIRHFGFLASVTMIVDLVAELLITPAIVMSTTIITIWDLLYLKLGPEPEKQIPLFHGLRPLQAKIVVLMARLASATPGTFITRRGEMKPELYVLLSGCVEVRPSANGPVIDQLCRGDVIGDKTFGDGSVQKTITLPDGSALSPLAESFPLISPGAPPLPPSWAGAAGLEIGGVAQPIQSTTLQKQAVQRIRGLLVVTTATPRGGNARAEPATAGPGKSAPRNRQKRSGDVRPSGRYGASGRRRLLLSALPSSSSRESRARCWGARSPSRGCGRAASR